jgi:hypothetical protein
MKSERRHDRSARPEEAVGLFLESVKKKLSLKALTLGTLDGDLIFGAGDDLERVAMLGSKVDAGESHDRELATWRTTLGNVSVVMTSWGGPFSPDLADGVRRILG